MKRINFGVFVIGFAAFVIGGWNANPSAGLIMGGAILMALTLWGNRNEPPN